MNPKGAMKRSNSSLREFKRYPECSDSGVEWLGEIPEYWSVIRMKFLVADPPKYGGNETAELDDPELARYVRITDVKEDVSLRVDTFRSLPEDVAMFTPFKAETV
jgi:type I restriction enzyme S subunit